MSVCDLPGLSRLVPLPVHELRTTPLGVAQILKSCTTFPLFVTLKTTLPAGIIETFESLNASSDGLPATTLIVVVTACFCCAAAGDAATPSTHAPRPAARQAKAAKA